MLEKIHAQIAPNIRETKNAVGEITAIINKIAITKLIPTVFINDLINRFFVDSGILFIALISKSFISLPIVWCPVWDSNPRLKVLETSALATELTRHCLVGLTGLEPVTFEL